MKLLAIESSCDETAAAVVENGRTVLSSVVASQIEDYQIAVEGTIEIFINDRWFIFAAEGNGSD